MQHTSANSWRSAPGKKKKKKKNLYQTNVIAVLYYAFHASKMCARETGKPVYRETNPPVLLKFLYAHIFLSSTSLSSSMWEKDWSIWFCMYLYMNLNLLFLSIIPFFHSLSLFSPFCAIFKHCFFMYCLLIWADASATFGKLSRIHLLFIQPLSIFVS